MNPCEPPENRAVGQQRHVVAQAGTHDGGGRRQHFRHAGSAFGTFVANDDDVAFVDLLLFQGREHLFFGIEHVGGSGKHESLFAGDLGDRTFGREVASQDLDVTRRFDRIAERANDFLPFGQSGQIGRGFPPASCPSRSGSRRSATLLPAGTSSPPACRRRRADLPGRIDRSVSGRPETERDR